MTDKQGWRNRIVGEGEQVATGYLGDGQETFPLSTCLWQVGQRVTRLERALADSQSPSKR